MGFLIGNLQTCKSQLQTLDVCKTTEITPTEITPTPQTTPSFLQKQMLTGSLQNNCSKQQLKLPGRPASVLQKDFTMDVLPLTSFQRQNQIFAMSMVMLRCECRDFQMAVKSLPPVYTKQNFQLSPWVLLLLLEVSFTVANETANWRDQC